MVTVAAAVEQVQTASGDVTRVIGSRQLSQIALNGGNYSQLLRLIPGAVATTLDPFGLALSTTAQRVNGIRTDSMLFMVDGTDNMDNGANRTPLSIPTSMPLGRSRSSPPAIAPNSAAARAPS